jgi:hypothetical protein
MNALAVLLLSVLMGSAWAAEPAAPASQAAPAAAANDAAAPTKESLEQAFDGAMTCSALTAIIAQSAAPAEAWRWQNRSLAFGLLARNFYANANQAELSSEEMDNKLTSYANSLQTMPAKEREPFDTGCARKYTQMDKFCEQLRCPNAPPAAAPKPSK